MFGKSLVIVSQIASSLTNFSVGFFVLWGLSITEFADYSIVMSIGLFLVSIQNALISTPLMIEKGKLRDSLVNVFFGYGVKLLYMLVIPISIFLLLLDVGEILFLSVIYFPLVLGRELCRMVIIWWSDINLMAVFEIVQLFATLVLLLMMYSLGVVSILNVYVALSIPMLISFAYLVYVYGLKKVQNSNFSYRDIWHDVKWSIKGVLVTEMNSRGYVYIVTLFFGKELLALFNAPRLIVNPINSIGYALVKFSKPKVAAEMNNGSSGSAWKILQEFRLFTYVIAIISAIFCYYLWGYIYSILFNKFDEIEVASVAVFWFFVLILQISNMYMASFLQVCKKFKKIFIVSTISAVIVFTYLFILVSLGISDRYILFSALISELFLFFGFLKLIRMALINVDSRNAVSSRGGVR